jgi:hypothetical protein
VGGRSYFLQVLDDFNRYMWIELLRSKDEALFFLKKIKQRAKVEHEGRLEALRTDRGGEFNSISFTVFCNEEGIKHYTTAPYSPQQNGVVERRNQSVVEMARCMLKTKRVPSKFWGEAVTTAVYVLNRCPTKSVQGKTPYEAWHGIKPKVDHLRTFGCVGHVKRVGPGLNKLVDRSTKMVLLGYESGTKGYRLVDPLTEQVHISRDVVFEEEKGWIWDNEHSTQQSVDTSDPCEIWFHNPVPVQIIQHPAASAAGSENESSSQAGPSDMNLGGAGTPQIPPGSPVTPQALCRSQCNASRETPDNIMSPSVSDPVQKPIKKEEEEKKVLYFHSYGHGGGSDVGRELPLHGAATLELVAGRDDPEAHGRAGGAGAAAADPAMDGVVPVVQRVLVLVVHLPPELWLHGIHQQDGLLVSQWSTAWRDPVCLAGHVPLYVV